MITVDDLTKYMSLKQVEHSLHISLRNKFIFVQVPKAAHSTILRTLRSIEMDGVPVIVPKGSNNRICSPFLLPFQLPNEMFDEAIKSSDWTRVCFVRNPYTRLLSCYLDKMVKNMRRRSVFLEILGFDPETPVGDISFEDFVDAVCKQEPLHMNPHWREQNTQLFGGAIKFDFVGKVENLEADICAMQEHIFGRVVKPLESVLNHRTNAEQEVSHYYTKRIQEKVLAKYKADFERFDYDTQLPQ